MSAVYVCDIARGYLKPHHFLDYTLHVSSSFCVCPDPVVADYCILKGRLCLLWHGDVALSGEIMQDCVSAKKAIIFSTV